MRTTITRARSSRSPTRSNTASTSATTLSERRSPLAERWRALGKQRALIPYLTAGFPTSDVSLEQGMTVARVLELVGKAALEVPVVIMTYLNPVMAYGVERFARDARAAGVAGVILTDLPAGADPAVEQVVRTSALD